MKVEFYKFIKFKGPDAAKIGYFVPGLYKLPTRLALKIFGLQYLRERLAGWTIWWVGSKHEYEWAKDVIDELRKTRKFTFSVTV